MKTKISPTIVGGFVLGALVLLVFAIVNFGAGGLFRKPLRFVVVIRQTSVSGLDPGSPVKFSGVRVGRVEQVFARFDPEASEVLVRVIGEIDPEVAASLFPPPAPDAGELIPKLIAQGLHSKLALSGITGMMYIDLTFPDNALCREVEIDAETSAPIVPVLPSVLAELADTLGSIADSLAGVDFAGISRELRAVLVNLDTITKDLDVKGALDRIGAAADSVSGVASDPNLRQAFERLNGAVGELQDLLVGLREATPGLKEELDGVLADASAAMKSLTSVAENLNGMVGERSGLAEEIGLTLESIDRAARSAERLIEYLERNPGALVRGRVTNPDTTTNSRP